MATSEPDLVTDLVGTLAWRQLRQVLLDALADSNVQREHELDLERVTDLYSFMAEHWGTLAPREKEVVRLQLQITLMERERAMLRQELALLKPEAT